MADIARTIKGGKKNMSNGFRLMSPENFKSLNEIDTKLNIIHDYLYDLHSNQSNQTGVCEKRFNAIDFRFAKLDRRKTINTSLGIGSGFLGGMVAMLGKIIFWR